MKLSEVVNPNGPKVGHLKPMLGCDPELFIAQGEKIVGSELVIPDAGLDSGAVRYSAGNKVVQDGVQVEMHPRPSTCRESLMFGIAAAFITLKKQLDAKGSGMKASFASVIDMDPTELDKLSEKSKRLGCAPSFNAYDKNANIAIDATTYLKRSAGGHIHFGLNAYSTYTAGVDPSRYATACDIMLGNQSVMIDRDPNASERRKVYGRAGEYRTPPHGFEYRTLSNFWLRHCSLTSGVLGMGRQGIGIIYCSECHKRKLSGYNWTDFETELLKRVDVDAVREAINNNDLALAKKNWAKIKQYILEFVPVTHTGLNPNNVDAFEFFCHKIEQKGLDYWFPEDPMEHWTAMQNDASPIGRGWERFLANKVQPKMNSSKTWKGLSA